MHTIRRAAAGVLVLAASMGLGACSEGNVFSLAVGTCFDDVDEFSEEGGAIENVPIVDCDDPHDNEVYALFDIAGDEYPGDAAVDAEAATGCVDRFEGYVERDYETSRFVAAWLTPTSQSWDGGDREVVCFLYDIDFAEIEGTARATGE